MNQETIGTLVRALLKFGGGILISKGVLDDATFAEVSGALMTLFGVVWGIVAARQASAAKSATAPAPRSSIPLMGLGALGLAAVLSLTACATTSRAIVTVTSVVDVAMKDWAQASAAGQTTPDLDARVTAAHDHYRAVCGGLAQILEAAQANGDQATAVNALQTLRAAVDPLLELIGPLVSPAEAQRLNTQLNTATAP